MALSVHCGGGGATPISREPNRMPKNERMRPWIRVAGGAAFHFRLSLYVGAASHFRPPLYFGTAFHFSPPPFILERRSILGHPFILERRSMHKMPVGCLRGVAKSSFSDLCRFWVPETLISASFLVSFWDLWAFGKTTESVVRVVNFRGLTPPGRAALGLLVEDYDGRNNVNNIIYIIYVYIHVYMYNIYIYIYICIHIYIYIYYVYIYIYIYIMIRRHIIRVMKVNL